MVQKSASAYERHQQISQIVNELKSVRVHDLAARLDVSESTIRTDLESLDEQGKLIRVRGGALTSGSPQPFALDYVDHKAAQQQEEKRQIARWAASMVEDGDGIMLDASSTVLHIASFLLDRQNLTVITNGIKVAQILATEPSNTVIVLGGILRPNGNAITGSISEKLLRSYHIQRAFVSCSGFDPSIGFFETDLQETQLKELMLRSAQQRFVLLDSSKVGRVGLTTFATLDDVHYVATDQGVDRETVNQVRMRGTHVVVCGEQTAQTYSPTNSIENMYRIGFANLSEHTPFSRDVRRGVEQTAASSGNIDLILGDNRLDPAAAIQVADRFLEQNLDLVIEYQVDEATGDLIVHRFQRAGIPVIAVDIPMVGATYFGVDNYVAGKMAGVELGQVIDKRWGGVFEHLIVVEQERTGKLLAMRIQGQIDGLRETLPPFPDTKMIRLDFDNTVEGSYNVMRETLDQIPTTDRIAVVCFNDDAAIGVLRAAEQSGHINNLLLAGQGADRRLRLEMRKQNTAVVGSTAYCPECYGEYLVPLALDILSGKAAAPAHYVEHFFVHPGNVNELYPNDLYDDILVGEE